MVHGKAESSYAAKRGLVAGIVGGAVMWAFLAAVNAARGQDVWTTFKGAAGPFIGARAMQPGFDLGAIAAGVACHFVVSMIWGLLFALFFYGLAKGTTVLAGFLWGVVVWLGMFYVVLPIVGMGQVNKIVPISFAIFEHLVFGVATAVGFLPYQRRVIRPEAAGIHHRVPIKT